jgi:hypothetical protein
MCAISSDLPPYSVIHETTKKRVLDWFRIDIGEASGFTRAQCDGEQGGLDSPWGKVFGAYRLSVSKNG